ncbi:hypothetical protein DERP_001732 [Dermatophagoides pteronyssinus]|uniref:Gustatory receptor n=1 Tax=Dermatophagoides pteronyssinus TaxID=6956 RepID=A0ABQ8JBE1_DERPT|nr:hypothetical protein DERP_001732 [Dermatophagoides pteronyssinus]
MIIQLQILEKFYHCTCNFFSSSLLFLSNLWICLAIRNLDNVIKMIWPLILNRPIKYIENYLICYRIYMTKKQNHELYFQKVKLPVRIMETLFIIMAIRCIYFVKQSQYKNDQTWIMLNGNIIRQNGLDNYANLFIFAMIIQAYLFLRMLYYNNPCANLLDCVLIGKKKQVFFRPYRYRTYLAIDFVEFVIKIWLYAIYYFVIYIELCMIGFSLTAYQFIAEHSNEFFNHGLFGYLLIVQIIINRLLFSVCFIFYAHVSIMMATTVLAFILIIVIQCWQTRQFLFKVYNFRQSSIHIYCTLSKFQKCHTKNLERFNLRTIYSKALSIFLIFNIPFNCYLLIFLIFRTNNWIIRYYYGSVCLQQIICMFGIHLMFAMCSNSFQKTSKRFISLLAINRKKIHLISIGQQLKINNYGQCFHTKNKYGLTYASNQLVSMMGFVKYLLLYSQAFMFIYTQMIGPIK